MTKRVLSFMMSAVMLIGHVLTSMQVYAQEGPDTEVALEAPPDYIVSIPQMNGLSVDYDMEHFDRKTDDGTARLIYHENDEVKLTISVASEYELKKIQVVTDEKKDIPLEWESDQVIRFSMPAEDVKLQADLHILQAEPDNPEELSEPAVENDPAVPAQEEVVEETGDAPSQVVEDPDSAAQEENSVEPAENMPVEDTSAQTTADDTVAGENADETPSSDTLLADGGETAASEADPAQKVEESIPMEIALEEDGFPVQGSVIRLSEWSIAFDATSIDSEKTFSEVNYPQDTVKASMLSNEVLFSVPGNYDVVYRCDETNTGRFWYVIRPVRVMNKEESMQGETQENGSEEGGSDDSDEESEEEDSDSPDAGDEIQENPEQVMTGEVIETEVDPLDGLFSVSAQIPNGITVSMDHEDGVYEIKKTVKFFVTADTDLFVSSIVIR